MALIGSCFPTPYGEEEKEDDDRKSVLHITKSEHPAPIMLSATTIIDFLSWTSPNHQANRP